MLLKTSSIKLKLNLTHYCEAAEYVLFSSENDIKVKKKLQTNYKF